MEPIDPERLADRRWSYKIALEGIIGSPELLLEYAKWKGVALDKAFIALDNRIRELEIALATKQEGAK